MGYRFVSSVSHNGITFTRAKTSSEYTDAYNSAVLRYNGAIDEFNVKKEEYETLEKKVKSWEEYLPTLSDLISNYNSVKTALSSSLSSFANGGYISDGVPLLSGEISGMLSTIDGATAVTSVYGETETRLSELKQELEQKKQAMDTAYNIAIRTRDIMNTTYPKYKSDAKS